MPSRLDQSIQAATSWHAGQVRDGENPLPYITHPMEVLTLLRHIGGVTDEEMLCAAVLHDVIEASNIKPEEIGEIAGPRARQLVIELTRREPSADETKGMTKPQIWELRSKMLLAEIAKMSPDAQQIKLADRLSNLREAKHAKSGEKLERYLRQTRGILRIIPRKVNFGLWDSTKSEL